MEHSGQEAEPPLSARQEVAAPPLRPMATPALAPALADVGTRRPPEGPDYSASGRTLGSQKKAAADQQQRAQQRRDGTGSAAAAARAASQTAARLHHVRNYNDLRPQGSGVGGT